MTKKKTPPTESPKPSKQPKSFAAWYMVWVGSAYQVVEVQIEDDKVVSTIADEPNVQGVQLQKIEDYLLDQAHNQ